MTARVITDPSALGWVLDPDTGRWEWSGSGDGGGVEEAPEDGVQYARQNAAWSPIESAGGYGGDLLERIVIPKGSDNVKKVELTEFDDTYISFELVMRDVSPSGFTAHALSVINMELEMTDAGSAGYCQLWTMSYWRSTTSYHSTQSPFNGKSAPIFGNDANATFSYRGGMNGSIKIFSGSQLGVSTSKRPDLTYYLSEGTTGENGMYFRNYGQAGKIGRVSKMALSYLISPGLQSGTFELYGMKGD